MSNIAPETYESVRSFIGTHPNFLSEIEVGPNEYINVEEELLNRAINANPAELYSIYNSLLRNQYVAPSLMDKAELCMFYLNQISLSDNELVNNALSIDMGLGEAITTREYFETAMPYELNGDLTINFNGHLYSLENAIDYILKRQICHFYIKDVDQEILDSDIDLGNGKKEQTKKYILETLPKKMTSLFKIKFTSSDLEYDVSETIKKIIANQKVEIEKTHSKDHENQIKNNNRFTESADLYTIGTEVVDGKTVFKAVMGSPTVLDGITKTPDISLSYEESEAASDIPNYSHISDDEYFKMCLNNMMDAIKNCRNNDDLEDTYRNLEEIVKSSYQISLSPAIERTMNYVYSLVEAKKQEILKYNDNLEDYANVIKNELETIISNIEQIDTLEELAIITSRIAVITREIISKNIKEEELDILLTRAKNALNIASARISITSINSLEDIPYVEEHRMVA